MSTSTPHGSPSDILVDPGLWDPEPTPPSVNGSKPPLSSSVGIAPVAAPDDLGRLVYLLVAHKIRLPRILAQALPFGRELAKLHEGLGAAGSVAELAPLYKSGAVLGKGSVREAQGILSRMLDGREFDDPFQRIEAYRLVATMVDGDLTNFSPYTEVELHPAAAEEVEEIPKFDSGFTPLDLVTGGLYQALMVFMASPGTGKTSLMLTLMEELVNQGNQVWFYETEITAKMMQARVAPIIRRGAPFLATGSRIRCGPWTVDDIMEHVQQEPNLDRVIMFDGPDAQFTQSTTGERRFDLEQIYQKLILVKFQSKMVVASSQPRRNDRELQLTSTAESWAKAWYADIMIGIERQGLTTLAIKCLKNRFGPLERRQFMFYDYADLSWKVEGAGKDDNWKDADW